MKTVLRYPLSNCNWLAKQSSAMRARRKGRIGGELKAERLTWQVTERRPTETNRPRYECGKLLKEDRQRPIERAMNVVGY